MASLYEEFVSRFQQDSAKISLETQDGEQITYSELLECSGKLARFVRESGISPGDRIAVQVEKSLENILLYLACLQTGAVYLPLNTAYRPAELEYFFNDAQPRLIVCDPGMHEEIKSLPYRYPSPDIYTLDKRGQGSLTESTKALPPDLQITDREEGDLAAILYTSGTTGRSKGAMLTQGNLLSNALTLHQHWGWQEGDVLLHALPIFHVHGLFVALHCAFLNTSPILLMPKFDVRQVMEMLPRASVFMGVPTYYTRLLVEPGFNGKCCDNMRLFISGSAPLHTDTFKEFNSRTGHTILERYGMTEAGMITSNPLEGERRCGSVGKPLAGVTVRIVDEAGEEVGVDTVGSLEISGPNVFAGYWNMPDKTREEFTPDGMFITGDLAKKDKDAYISIVGRSKDMVISGGYNVYPKEIESVIDDMQDTLESAVFGIPDKDYGEAVVAAVVMSKDVSIPNEDGMRSKLKQKLASYKVPKQIFFVGELPRNTMGKVQKNILREQYS